MPAITHTVDFVHEYRTKIALVLITACGAAMFVYALNIYRVVAATVSLDHVRKEMATLTAAVDNLDSQYLKLSSTITPDSLKNYGLTQGTVTAFIPRSTSLPSVALGGHEF